MRNQKFDQHAFIHKTSIQYSTPFNQSKPSQRLQYVLFLPHPLHKPVDHWWNIRTLFPLRDTPTQAPLHHLVTPSLQEYEGVEAPLVTPSQWRVAFHALLTGEFRAGQVREGEIETVVPESRGDHSEPCEQAGVHDLAIIHEIPGG